MPNGHHSELDALRSEDYAREIAAKDAELQSERQAHQICVEMRDEAETEIARLRTDLVAKDAEIARLQAHLKAIRLEIEQSWQRVQAALSTGE